VCLSGSIWLFICVLNFIILPVHFLCHISLQTRYCPKVGTLWIYIFSTKLVYVVHFYEYNLCSSYQLIVACQYPWGKKPPAAMGTTPGVMKSLILFKPAIYVSYFWYCAKQLLHKFCLCPVIVDCYSKGGNAIASVRLSVCFHSVFRTNWPLTLNSCMWIGHDHSSQGIESQGHRSRSKSWVRLMRSVRPRSRELVSHFVKYKFL